MARVGTSAAAVERLREFYTLNGYLRLPSLARREEGPLSYKKGYELRLVAGSQEELREIQRLLQGAGFRLGRPFAKSRQWRQPIYGRDAVTRFLKLIGESIPAPLR